MLFFVSVLFCFQNNIFGGEDSFKIFVFFIISSICGFLKVYLSYVEIWFFSFNDHFLIIMCFKI